ncbi:DUF2911 domain-containing protein [Neptunitalea lumnitzerae]|uniref:DUF2911 domain-containing protein n=1 Tax=Neptunitalea lumnitzerae TaxID=2965509 RepID=A0ABQ5MEC3_9FLAO|nr:DUF2911 domain-containing protein [Neptunitalea sp. Y10]GLB47703.1 hypothetical protein Y10_00710 [Neptunitalea sp. Y10]
MKKGVLVLLILAMFISCNNHEKMDKGENIKETVQLESYPGLDIPTKSQFSTVSQKLGVSNVSIGYFRPNVNDRNVWGEVVEWDSVWRAGAESSTVFEIEKDVYVGKSESILPKGKYSFFIIPKQNTAWEVVFNKDNSLYGTSGYDSKKDVLRLKVNPVSSSEFFETMTFMFDEVKDFDLNIKFGWADKSFEFPIRIDESTVWDEFNQYFKSKSIPDSIKSKYYLKVANFCVFTNDTLKAEECLSLVDKSIDKKPDDFNAYIVKSELLALLMDYESAVVYAKKAHSIGSKSRKMPLEVANHLEENITKYQTLTKL